ncbi:hypothetical protein B0F90DRAFT_1810446 [Multifurca ochricompacta]|uniref:F-box domain-containing protein n=1 Tax=Multifurca ochricompacta TaxID=376703 RepID=A0AAD4M4D1_9AGAM|nr:hypothetical protein B0F90DRAFT_1810446 [Multifurca ochricompacta]
MAFHGSHPYVFLGSRVSRVLQKLLHKRRSKRNTELPRITSRRTYDHSRLPPEIWHLIIREATFMAPDPLDTTNELSFLETTSLHLPAYCSAMRFKLALTLVSKRWNALAKPFLYEFVWISRAQQAKALAHTLLLEFVEGAGSSGRFIRRLHIETPVLERCAPADLHTILEYSRQLTVYTDHQSVQRNRYDIPTDPRCRPERLLSLLAHPRSQLRRLSWTNYDDQPFQQRMSPLQQMRTMRLEYLELSSCSPNFRSFFSDPTFTASHTGVVETPVQLPALKSLKVSLDNDMFATLATWGMPTLRNLSVVSADFGHAGPGFYQFLEAHGKLIKQLELGHSSSIVEEHYLTAPDRRATNDFSLVWMCPNVTELIFSADVEWHWESPDWIVPHVLLPYHPRVELIAIRDMHARITDALSMGLTGDGGPAFFPLLEQMSSLLRHEAFPALKYIRDLSVESTILRTRRPHPAVEKFWNKVLSQCQVRGVWLEDHVGVNITLRGLKRASLM